MSPSAFPPVLIGLTYLSAATLATGDGAISQPRSVATGAVAAVDGVSATKSSAAESSRPAMTDKVGNPMPGTVDSKLLTQVRRVLDAYYRHPLNTRDDAPWSVLHWSIAYGVEATVRSGGPDGEPVTAIGWLCFNYPSAGMQLMTPVASGIELPVGPGRQGHDGQFLAMLAQSRVKRDYELRVGERTLVVADLVEHEKRTCRSGRELTFKLIGLVHYEELDATWKNQQGEPWSIERLLREELQEPIDRTATCGGLHRLYAISSAADRREVSGKPLAGPWRTARERTRTYQRRAFEMQNADGSFSTNWLDSRESRADATRRLTTSGHILEWLVMSLPAEQLDDKRLERGLVYVAGLLEGKEKTDWHRGALGHALHALAVYERRVGGDQPRERRASSTTTTEGGDPNSARQATP